MYGVLQDGDRGGIVHDRRDAVGDLGVDLHAVRADDLAGQLRDELRGQTPGVDVQAAEGALGLTAGRDRVGGGAGRDAAPDQRHAGTRIDPAR